MKLFIEKVVNQLKKKGKKQGEQYEKEFKIIFDTFLLKENIDTELDTAKQAYVDFLQNDLGAEGIETPKQYYTGKPDNDTSDRKYIGDSKADDGAEFVKLYSVEVLKQMISEKLEEKQIDGSNYEKYKIDKTKWNNWNKWRQRQKLYNFLYELNELDAQDTDEESSSEDESGEEESGEEESGEEESGEEESGEESSREEDDSDTNSFVVSDNEEEKLLNDILDNPDDETKKDEYKAYIRETYTNDESKINAYFNSNFNSNDTENITFGDYYNKAMDDSEEEEGSGEEGSDEAESNESNGEEGGGEDNSKKKSKSKKRKAPKKARCPKGSVRETRRSSPNYGKCVDKNDRSKVVPETNKRKK